MKQIPLKTISVNVPNEAEPVPLTYAESFRAVLGAPRRDGYSLEDIRTRVPIVDKLTAAIENESASLLLEDAQYKHLLAAVRAHRFGIVSRAILDMVDDLEHAPDVDVRPVAGEADG